MMNNATDTKTADLLPNHDLAGERPAKPTAKELARARTARYREKHGNVKGFTVQLPVDLIAKVDAYVTAKGKGRTKSQIIQKLIETQLLRPR